MNISNRFLELINRYKGTVALKYTLDGVGLCCAYSLSYGITIIEFPLFALSSVVLFFWTILVMGGLGFLFKVYQHIWRFTSVYNIVAIVKWTVTGSVFIGMGMYLTLAHPPHQLLLFCLLFCGLSTGLLSVNRIAVRLAFEHAYDPLPKDEQSVLLIGAGKGAEFFIREVKKKRSPENYNITAILDDDPALLGRRLFGIKIYGSLKNMESVVVGHDIKMIVVAIPSIPQKKLANLLERAKSIGVPIRVLPSFEKMLAYNTSTPEEVSLDELLGRDRIHLNKNEVAELLSGQTILVTGAGGSIGSEICRQIIPLNPKRLILVDHSEYNLYAISWELENTLSFANFEPILASVSKIEEMKSIFEIYKPDMIFHAAAYKHVPLLENQEKQAIKNNFLGTKIVAECAAKYNAKKFVLVSTDKAVNPTNVMGSTKRMAEIFCQYLNQKVVTNYVTVRFGNVLGSAGSVIPLFMKQLKAGGPLTVTHKDITRFFMSIPEASQLVLQAGAMGKGGEIFVLDMGQPVKISTLAERLIQLTGREPYRDIDIVYTGLRPGEKLYEELFYENEEHLSTNNKKIFLAAAQSIDFDLFTTHTEYLLNNISTVTNDEIRSIIKRIVPEAKI